MVRRFVLAGLSAALVAPIYVAPPAAGAVLFTCSGIDTPPSYIGFNPGWSHTPTAQNALQNLIEIGTPCTNAETASVSWGNAWGYNPSMTYASRPLGCPVVWGGAGPDHADQTPILIGSDPAFRIDWGSTASQSFGLAKAKAGPAGDQYRVILNITSGPYAPPSGKKTKMKLTVALSPYPGWTYTCADDSDPLEYAYITSVGDVIVNQKAA
jgi:hypothetical protein